MTFINKKTKKAKKRIWNIKEVISNFKTSLSLNTWKSCTYQVAKQDPKESVSKYGAQIHHLLGAGVELQTHLTTVPLNQPLPYIGQ